MICIFCVACSPSSNQTDFCEDFLFELYTSNINERYALYEDRISAIDFGAEGQSGVLQDAMDTYYSNFKPICTDLAYEKLLKSALPMAIDKACLDNKVTVTPISVQFTSAKESSTGAEQYYDYELTIRLSGAAEEDFVVLGSIAVGEENGTSLISVHVPTNDKALFEKLRST